MGEELKVRRKTSPVYLLWVLAILFAAKADPVLAVITYPQMGVGGGYETVVTITNPTTVDWAGRISCRQGTFSPFPISLKANGQYFSDYTPWTVAAGRTLQVTITGDSTLRAGFLRIERVTGPADTDIATSVFYRLKDSAGISRELIASYPAKPSMSAVFAVEKGATQDTGIAFVVANPPDFSPNISFRLINHEGVTVQKVERPYEGHTALMVGELFDQIPPQFLGSVVIDSPVELCVLVLRLEIIDGNIQLTGNLPNPMPVLESGIRVMRFRPIDAEYSNALDKVIAVASSPYALHIYDPETNTSETIGLSGLPMSVSVSADGKQAVVGHSSSFSYVNLVDKKIEKVVPTAFNCYDVVLAGNGYVYVFPSGDQWVKCYRVKLADGEATELDQMTRYTARGRLHPGGKKVYRATDGSVTCFNTETGEITYNHQGYGPDLWFSQDGLRIFLSVGQVLRSSDLAAQDMQPNGNLQAMLSCVYHLASTGTLVWLPISYHHESQPGRKDDLNVVNYEDLQPRKKIPLPDFPGPHQVRTRGMFVFGNAAGTKLVLIVRADAGSGLLDDYGLMLVDASSLVN